MFEATWEPSAHLANVITALADFLATRGGPRMGTCVSQGGGVMLGFVCLFAVCSTVAAVFVCAYALLVLCTCCTCLPCVWGKPTKGVRTIDRVRVNGW